MAASESEWRPLTLVFCDIVNSIAIEANVGAESFKALIESAYAAWQGIIESYGGRIERYMGDGVLAYFSSAGGLERAPDRAVRAALEMVALSVRPNAPHPRDVGDVAVRVGVATGMVIVGQPIGEGPSREAPAVGKAPNLAARLVSIAKPNTVLISADTHGLVQEQFECRFLGTFDLKGFSEPESVWQVIRALPKMPRLDAEDTVGREAEMDVLAQCWSRTCSGHGQFVHVFGDPGIGKSHLGEAFLRSISPAAGVVLRCQCSALHANTAFHPIIEEVLASARISHDDHAATRLEKLEALLGACTSAPDRLVPAFARLLSLPTREANPELAISVFDARGRIIDALVERLRLHAERTAVVLFIEDMQWSDHSTRDFIATAMSRLRNANVLILMTSRPGFTPPASEASDVVSIRVDRLERGEVNDLVARVCGRRALSESARTQIVERADGVPLFAKELTRWMLLTGGARTASGGVARGTAATIPATLHDSLVAQLDRLGPARFVAQFGAIIGRSFPYWLLARLWPFDEASLRPLLDEIVEAGLLTRRGEGPEEHYVFKHELLREAAYESLLKSKRQPLHVQIAQIITSERARASGMRPELIAYHYTAAGLGQKAAPLWLEAGQLALRESANHEARASLQQGLACLAFVPDEEQRSRLELRLQTCLGQALIAILGHASPEVLAAFERAHELSRKLGDVPELFTIVWGITAHHLVKGDITLHLELSANLLDIARASNDSGELIVAHTSRTISHYFAGQLAASRRHLDEVLRRYDWDKHRHLAAAYAVDRKMIALQFGSWTLWTLGFADQAAGLEEELNSHARRLGHPNSLVQALTAGASVYMLRREPDRLLARVAEGIAITDVQGYPVWIDHGDFWIGWALAEKGFLAEGILHLRKALKEYRRSGARSSLPKFFGLLADRLCEVGEHEEAQQLVLQALEHIEHTGERANEAETWRLHGKLLFARSVDDLAAAETSVRRAIEIARRQEAKAWELRATTTLAQMLRQRGRQRQARECLEPVYGWFSEGFDTPDLEDARALLRELG